MKTVWKYSLVERLAFGIPINSKILFAGNQNELPVVWIEVESEQTVMRPVQFYVINTGWEVPQDAEYLNTVIYFGGEFVQHIYVKGYNV